MAQDEEALIAALVCNIRDVKQEEAINGAAANRKISIQMKSRLVEFQWFGRRVFLTASSCLFE